LILRPDNHALDLVDELNWAALAVPINRLRRLTPATIQKGVCRGNAGRWRGFSRVHDAGKGSQRALCVASR
jgi:hypothetical protein